MLCGLYRLLLSSLIYLPNIPLQATETSATTVLYVIHAAAIHVIWILVIDLLILSILKAMGNVDFQNYPTTFVDEILIFYVTLSQLLLTSTPPSRFSNVANLSQISKSYCSLTSTINHLRCIKHHQIKTVLLFIYLLKVSNEMKPPSHKFSITVNSFERQDITYGHAVSSQDMINLTMYLSTRQLKVHLYIL